LENYFYNFDDIKDDLKQLQLEEIIKILDNSLSFDENPDANITLDYER
jgi:hypothetical protein